MSIKNWLQISIVVAVLSLGWYVNYQSDKITSLTTSLNDTRKEFKDFKESMERDMAALQKIDQDRKDQREQQKKNETKLRKDSKRSDTVAAKPKLVEKQINNSFNKLADDFTELTK